MAREALERMEQADRGAWIALLAHSRTASGARPGRRWLDHGRPLLAAVGDAVFRARVTEWLGYLAATATRGTGGADDATPPPAWRNAPLHLTESNAALLKGLVWCCSLTDLEPLVPALSEAGAQCFKKLPGSGPRAAGIGNACIQALGSVPGQQGLLRLQWLRQRVASISALKLIDATMEDAAQRAGVDADELAELLVPGFGLSDGRRREPLGDYVAEIVLGPRDGIELRWSKADGTPLRSQPVAVKRAFGDEVKALKATVQELRSVLSPQRRRLERLLLTERSWALREWRERYLDHGLVAHLARRLVWWFGEADQAQAGAWLAGQIVDAADRPLESLADDTPVRMWHPIGVAPEAVLAWRDWLERHAVTQPFKQAHREVYLLTDAELRTQTYSNRFAAHILRQHQFHALAQQRGWKAPLALVYDGGWGAAPSLTLPRWGLRAEYSIEAVLDDDNGEGGYNENGVCLYLSTDQVCFARLDHDTLVPLSEVPALVFSEVMRGVDLFVGVASVGNDPAWRDAGLAEHRAYWERYAFGALGESARTRHAVLERLLPRLTKLAGRATLADRFLVVRGDLRTYRIHLGSGNILMEPNSQYLCIVAAGGATAPGQTFLPFEGDRLLSIILSKALLLADDRAITDPTITRQISRR